MCHFLDIQQSLEEGELENVYWIPGTENPADGLTKLRSEMGPILALLETGRFQPGVCGHLRGWPLGSEVAFSLSRFGAFCDPKILYRWPFFRKKGIRAYAVCLSIF